MHARVLLLESTGTERNGMNQCDQKTILLYICATCLRHPNESDVNKLKFTSTHFTKEKMVSRFKTQPLKFFSPIATESGRLPALQCKHTGGVSSRLETTETCLYSHNEIRGALRITSSQKGQRLLVLELLYCLLICNLMSIVFAQVHFKDCKNVKQKQLFTQFDNFWTTVTEPQHVTFTYQLKHLRAFYASCNI